MLRWIQRLDDQLSEWGSTPLGCALLLAAMAAIVALAVWCPLPTIARGAP